MGLYDRDYYREPSRRGDYYQIDASQSWVLAIIIINVLIFLADFVRSGTDASNSLSHILATNRNTLMTPSLWWQFVTYGFAHSSFSHLFFNMFGLFIFGPLIERLIGAVEFLCFYLATIIVSGVVWTLLNPYAAGLVGASGGICGVVMLAVFNYPRMIVYFMGMVEMPMWVLGVIYVMFDVFGTMGIGGSNVAFVAHLAGSGFAAAYFYSKLCFTDIPSFFSKKCRQRSDRRKTFFNPKDYTESYRDDDYEDAEEKAQQQAEEDETRNAEVDAILRKISEKGKDSLTWNERRILKRASKEYQKKHKPK